MTLNVELVDNRDIYHQPPRRHVRFRAAAYYCALGDFQVPFKTSGRALSGLNEILLSFRALRWSRDRQIRKCRRRPVVIQVA